MDVARLTTYVNPSWCHISGLSFQEALGNGWLNAVHDDDKAVLLMVGKMKPPLKKNCQNIVSCALTAKLHGSWDSLFLR
jgi:PAS domain-containing protein